MKQTQKPVKKTTIYSLPQNPAKQPQAPIPTQAPTKDNATTAKPESQKEPETTKTEKIPEYNPEKMDEICSLISIGAENLTKICKIVKVSVNTVYGWLRTNAEARECYARAREDQADSKNEKVSEIMEKIEGGELDPNAARVMIDAIKWQTAHLNSPKYGNKLGIDAKVGVSVTINVIDRFDSGAKQCELSGKR